MVYDVYCQYLTRIMLCCDCQIERKDSCNIRLLFHLNCSGKGKLWREFRIHSSGLNQMLAMFMQEDKTGQARILRLSPVLRLRANKTIQFRARKAKFRIFSWRRHVGLYRFVLPERASLPRPPVEFRPQQGV